MAFSRSTTIDDSPTGDTGEQAVMKLDADLTLAYNYINQINASVLLKLDASLKDAVNGVAGLDASGKIKSSQLTDGIVDVGDIKPWPIETLPSSGDWLECNGALINCADYPVLFALLGYTYGGSGLQFALPDYRGQFLRGWDHGRTKDPDASTRSGGDHVGSTQADIIRKHLHPVGANTGKADGGASVFDPGSWGSYQHCYTADFGRTDAEVQADYGATGMLCRGAETRPVNINVMWIIRWR